MDFDALLHHYFKTTDPDAIDANCFSDGKHRLEIDFGTESDPGRKFALWTLMDALGFAPSPAEAFEKDAQLRQAAEKYQTTIWNLERASMRESTGRR